MRFGTACDNAYILKQPLKVLFTTKIIYSDFLEIIRSMQQEKLVVHYPDHGSISSNETEDPFMEFPRSFEIL